MKNVVAHEENLEPIELNDIELEEVSGGAHCPGGAYPLGEENPSDPCVVR
jgi:hypothetical protein